MSILVSVIIPCYNYARYLPDTLNSILAQDLEAWECIMVDDGSTDNTAEVAQEFVKKDNRFKYFYQNNSGPSVARNKGIEESNGQFLQFLDADDLIQNNKLAFQSKILLENKNIDVVYGDVRFFENQNQNNLLKSLEVFDKLYPMPRMKEENVFQTFKALYDFPLHPSVLLVRKKLVIDKEVFFSLKYDKSSVEDWHFFIWLAIRKAKFLYIDKEETYGLVRAHELSTNNTISKDKSNKIIHYRSVMLDFLSDEILEKKILRETDRGIVELLFRTRFSKEFSQGSISKGFLFFYKGFLVVPHKFRWLKDGLYYIKTRLFKGKKQF